jgi:arylsulfatase A-like enzyme
MKRIATLLVVVLIGLRSLAASAADNLVFVTWDGFRWQELFGGAEEELLSKELGGVPDVPALRSSFWRDLPEQRRKALLPFFWGTIARHGQVFGDPAVGSASRVTNGEKFSYPGYNEMFVGFADDAVKSNDKIPNKNINVLEYIHRQPGFGGRVAGFATWDVMDFILNRERSGFPLQTGWTEIVDPPLTPGQQQVNEMIRQLPRLWRGNVFDAVTFRAAKEYLIKHQPRVLYIGLGETDEWAHARRYDLYLEAANRSDQYLQELWELLQSMPQYKDQTTLVVTTDHGRGLGREWTNHSAQVVGAESIWIAAIGIEVYGRGVRKNVETTQSQVAATLASLVGVDFNKAFPQAAAPLSLKSMNDEK